MRKPLHTILVKPAGPDCNMGCAYCFYLSKAEFFDTSNPHRMPPSVLEEMVAQAMSQAGSAVTFAWQGGEPTLMGLPFFRSAVDLQQKYGKGQTVGNGLQTNGLLIDREWTDFLKRYRFLVGLSLDGPEHIHDRYRRLAGGNGSWHKAADAATRMLDNAVAVNALIVVNDYSVQFPEEIYSFHKGIGLPYMQFIPCLAPESGTSPDGRDPWVIEEEYGAFLCRLFDCWLADFSEGRPTTSIRFFEGVLSSFAGHGPLECTFSETCGDYLVVEHNGDVFPCDFSVHPAWRIGNVMENRLSDLLNSGALLRFGNAKADLPSACLECRWLAHCRGGCPSYRKPEPLEGGPNRLCDALRTFFDHADDRLLSLTAAWGRQNDIFELPSDATACPTGRKTGRNAPCPCGSGKKYKRCCGR
jgi:uncharacterized protein